MKRFCFFNLILLFVGAFISGCSKDDGLDVSNNLSEGTPTYNTVVDSLCATEAFVDTFDLAQIHCMSCYKFQKDGKLNILVVSGMSGNGVAEIDTLNLTWKLESKPADINGSTKYYYLKIHYDMADNSFSKGFIDTIEIRGGATEVTDSLVMSVAVNGEINLYGRNQTEAEAQTRGFGDWIKNVFVKVKDDLSTVISNAYKLTAGDEKANLIYGDWMGNVNDDVPVCKLSIPGSRSSLSYTMYDKLLSSKLQYLDLEEQWSAGVRCFDVPCFLEKEKTSVGKTIMDEYSVRTQAGSNSRLEVVFNDIYELVQQHKTETAIVVLSCTPDDTLKTKCENTIDSIVQQEYAKGRVVQWTPNITMAEARGHIIVVTKYSSILSNMLALSCVVDDKGVKSEESAWGDNLSNSYLLSNPYTPLDEQQYAQLYVQECLVQGSTEGIREYYLRKKQLAADNMSFVNTHKDSTVPVWSFNYMSGLSGDGYFATAYEMNTFLKTLLTSKPTALTGILMLDFAGKDEYSGNVFGQVYNSSCKDLPEIILKHNNTLTWNNIKFTNSEIK